MSSHREAPSIAFDPACDNTDTYAFVSAPGKVCIIASYSPFQLPASGPNFYEFGEDVAYELHIDNDGDGVANVKYTFRFTTTVSNPNTFLYNIGPIDSLSSPNLIRRQTYSVTKSSGRHLSRRQRIGNNLPVPPCNIGPRSTPNYAALANAAVQTLSGGEKVFCGQREDSFFVDVGSIFDLGTLRPFQHLHLIPTAAAPGVDTLRDSNVNTIVLEVDTDDLTRDGRTPTDVMSPNSVIGVWATASRQKATIRSDRGRRNDAGPWVQVSRLGNPLFNEVIVPMSRKDAWNAAGPDGDRDYEQLVKRPELAGLLPVLYPGVFPNLAALNADRADLHAILLTGIPQGIVDGFQNFTGPQPGDMLRLNVAIPPTAQPHPLGLVAGDPAGFPNGRRLVDDVTTIELRAVAGVTYKLIDRNFVPDAAAGAIFDGSYNLARRGFLPTFPYIGLPHDGYSVPAA
jgi:hypothetical protein